MPDVRTQFAQKNGEVVAFHKAADYDAAIAAGWTAYVPGTTEVDPSDLNASALNVTKGTLKLKVLGAAPTGPNAVGEVYVATGGVLKICTVAGSPGTWVSVGAQT